jgi:hypothetical protein
MAAAAKAAAAAAAASSTSSSSPPPLTAGAPANVVVVATPCVVSSNVLVFAADFVASWSAYVTTLAIAHPLDTLRVRRQTTGERVAHIIRADGARSLYAGILTPMLSNAPLVAVIFALNEFFRSFYRWAALELLGFEELRALPHFTHSELLLSGASAGCCASIVSTPTNFVKVQQQTRGRRGLPVPSAFHVVQEVVAANGPTGMYRAMWLDAVTSGIGRAVYFTGYEVLKAQIEVLMNRALGPVVPGAATASAAAAAPASATTTTTTTTALSTVTSRRDVVRNVMAAAATSSLGWIAVYPLEAVKVRLQADAILHARRQYPTFSGCFVDVYRTQGVAGFFRGFSLTMVKSWISSGLALPLYEFLRPHARARVPRCPEDATPAEAFGTPTTSIRDLYGS